jgi:glycosyltransferase involved in cell wall biosynthesis
MKLLILASHPVQYHAPVFRGISQLLAQSGHECVVAYLSDFSVQGYVDPEFDKAFAWDEPLLEGYQYKVLNQNSKKPPRSFFDLKAPSWGKLLQHESPDRLLVTTLNYQGAIRATIQSKLSGISCTFRVETNDEAMLRSQLKDMSRTLVYKNLYTLFDSAIAIGTLNQQHLVKHGFHPDKIGMAYYCVPNRLRNLSLQQKLELRQTWRQNLGFNDSHSIILFCGKLISKKNPDLLLHALAQLPVQQREKVGLVYVGSGELEEHLRTIAASMNDTRIHFAGFKNQLELAPYYLAADALALPSSRQGETWGLVVNEALQAGLPCIVTTAVGCAADFAGFPGFQVIREPDAMLLAKAVCNIMHIPRDFERYSLLMQRFSVENCCKQIATFLLNL